MYTTLLLFSIVSMLLILSSGSAQEDDDSHPLGIFTRNFCQCYPKDLCNDVANVGAMIQDGFSPCKNVDESRCCNPAEAGHTDQPETSISPLDSTVAHTDAPSGLGSLFQNPFDALRNLFQNQNRDEPTTSTEQPTSTVVFGDLPDKTPTTNLPHLEDIYATVPVTDVFYEYDPISNEIPNDAIKKLKYRLLKS